MTIAPDSWKEYTELLNSAAGLESRLWLPENEEMRAALYRQFAMSISQGYFLYFHKNLEHPDFVPYLNSAFLAQPNPDAIYHAAFVDGRGVYRVVGNRGNVPVVGFATGKAMYGTAEDTGPGFNNYDLDNVEMDEDGNFDVVFSAEKPEDLNSQWLYLNPDSEYIVFRQFSYDWGKEKGAHVAIVRLDTEIARKPMSVEDIDYNLRELFGDYVRRVSQVALAMMQRGRDSAPENTFRPAEYSVLGNSAEWPQAYYEGIYDIEDDEALILETELPKSHVYWNVQVIDHIWNQVELLYSQSSLNGHQAHIDSDGKFRAVLSLRDPGVHNWLDTLGNRKGMLIVRWYRCSDHPEPVLTKVKLSDVLDHLPEDTPTIGAQERSELLRKRAMGAQLRLRW